MSTPAHIWDAVIVGAGPAGAAAAYDLAARGRSVLLLDKAAFPRAKACAGGLTAKTLTALRFSVAPVTRATLRSIDLEHPSAPGGALTVSRSRAVCAMTVRSELDSYALEQALGRGAAFQRTGPLRALEQADDYVALHTEGREPVHARFVLGADGVHSRVRALLGEERPRWFRAGFALEANVPYTATGGRRFPLVFDFNPLPGGYGWLFPRNDHVNVGLGTFAEGADETPKLDRETLTRYIVARCGTAEHDRAVGQYLGMGGAHYWPSCDRVLLAGDAAGMVDALTGEGIYGAVVSGQAAAAAIDTALEQGHKAAGHMYRRRLRKLQADLRVSDTAAHKFYSEPARGFRLMRAPWVRAAVLRGYADGASLPVLEGAIAAARLLRRFA